MHSAFNPQPGFADNGAYLEQLRSLNHGLVREVLDNGMVVLIKPDHSAPVVSVQILVGTGSIHEGADLGGGLSHYMEHMIFKGTPTRGPADITRQIDEAGGSINAYTANDRTVFYADLPSRNWKVGVDVLSDAVMNASLPDDEWEREKDVILREFAMGKDSPGRVHAKLLNETAYRVHPYRVPVIGYEDVFRTMNRDSLERFFKQHYVPDNMIVSIAGHIDAGETLSYIKQVFSDFKRRARAPVLMPDEPAQLTPRIARKTGPYKVSRLHWTYHTVSIDHPDAAALDVLSLILGEGRSSILNQELREKRKLVHSINAWSHTPMQGGMFGISASFDPEKEAAVIAELRKLLSTLSDRKFSKSDIEKARRALIIDELSEMQTMSGQASSYAAGEYYTGNPRFSEHYLELIQKVDQKRLQDVYRQYLAGSFETIALLAPENEAGSSASAFNRADEFPIERVVLSNGVPLVIRQDNRLPFVYVSAALGGGLLSEEAGNNGITQLMSDLLTRGTGKRTSAEIADVVESRGASLSAFAGRNSFGLNAQGLAEDADLILDVLSDCLLEPVFPADEIARQKTEQCSAIRQQHEQPMYIAQEGLKQMLFPEHPYRLDLLGTETSVTSITRNQLEEYHRQHVATDNLAISIFGNIEPKTARALGEKYFGRIKGRAVKKTEWASSNPTLPARTDKKGPFEQSILLIGYPGITVKDPRTEAMNVLQRAMSGLSSDLAIEVREKRGLVYFVGALSMSGLEPGLFAFYAGTKAEQIGEVDTLIREQIGRIASSGLRTDEVERARAQLLAEHEMSLQNTGEQAMQHAIHELYGLGYQYVLSRPARIQSVTPEDIQKLAAAILSPDKSAVSIITPDP